MSRPNDLVNLKKIRKYCNEVNETIRFFGDNFSVFNSNHMFANAVSMAIMQTGEISKLLSPELKEQTADIIPWKDIKDLRNLFAHCYGTMNKRNIWRTAKNDIPELLKFCQDKIKQLEEDKIIPKEKQKVISPPTTQTTEKTLPTTDVEKTPAQEVSTSEKAVETETKENEKKKYIPPQPLNPPEKSTQLEETLNQTQTEKKEYRPPQPMKTETSPTAEVEKSHSITTPAKVAELDKILRQQRQEKRENKEYQPPQPTKTDDIER
jgi:uncharacterized protein with HEPN domain